jgi:hypothetical protein
VQEVEPDYDLVDGGTQVAEAAFPSFLIAIHALFSSCLWDQQDGNILR